MKINLSINRERLSKIFRISIRHGVVSLVCGSTEYALFLLFYIESAYSLAFSYVVSYLVATVIGYLLHNYFTFSVRLIAKGSVVFYLIQSISVLALGYAIINLFIWMLFVPQIAKFFQLVATFGFNVAFGRYFTFNKNYHRS